MNKDILTAKKILAENDFTCVLYSNGTECHSALRGVKPLIDFLESGCKSYRSTHQHKSRLRAHPLQAAPTHHG